MSAEEDLGRVRPLISELDRNSSQIERCWYLQPRAQDWHVRTRTRDQLLFVCYAVLPSKAECN
jgi:hypothetical protein